MDGLWLLILGSVLLASAVVLFAFLWSTPVSRVEHPPRAGRAKECPVTGLDPCPWHPDGGNHPVVHDA